MTEEIKEILDIIKLCYAKYEDNEHWKILLDYITNLQEENKTLKECKENATRKHWQQKCYEHHIQEKLLQARIDKAIGRISLLKMDDITIETNKALDYVLKSLKGSDEE